MLIHISRGQQYLASELLSLFSFSGLLAMRAFSTHAQRRAASRKNGRACSADPRSSGNQRVGWKKEHAFHTKGEFENWRSEMCRSITGKVVSIRMALARVHWQSRRAHVRDQWPAIVVQVQRVRSFVCAGHDRVASLLRWQTRSDSGIRTRGEDDEIRRQLRFSPRDPIDPSRRLRLPMKWDLCGCSLRLTVRLTDKYT